MMHSQRWTWTTALVVTLGAALVATTSCTDGTSGAHAVESKSDQATNSGGEGAADQQKPTVEPTPVETFTVQTGTFRDTFEVPGRTTAKRKVRVAAEAAGQILQAPFEEGDTVDRGDLLLRVESDVDNARINRLEHQLETARRELTRLEKLSEDGLATGQQLDQAQSQVEELELRIREAKIGLANVSTRSPLSGRVTRKFVESGEFASPGAPIAEIVDTSTLTLTAAVPESRITALKEEMSVSVAFPAVDETREAAIDTLPVDVNPRTRTYPVEVTLDNEDGAIRPGMRASLEFTQKTYEEAVVVPRTAVLQGYNGQEVAVVDPSEDGRDRAELRTVELGPGRGNRVVVTDGLGAEDELVIRGHRSLTKGMPVKVVKHYETLDAALR